MSDKVTAGLVTFAAVVPLCAVCLLGPAAAGVLLASLAGWLGGFGTLAIGLAAAGSAALGYTLWRRRRRARESRVESPLDRPGSMPRP